MNKHNKEQIITPNSDAYDAIIQKAISRRTEHALTDGKWKTVRYHTTKGMRYKIVSIFDDAPMDKGLERLMRHEVENK